MGKLADAIRGLALPSQKQTQLLRLDVQYVELEFQMDSFKEQNDALREENEKFKKANQKLKSEIARLEEQVKALTSKKEKNVVHEELDEIEQTVLSYLAGVRVQDRTTVLVAKIVQDCHPDSHMTPLAAEVYLKRLERRELVQFYPSGYSYSAAMEHWDLTDRGKECVVVKRLEIRKSSGAPTADLDPNEIEIMKFVGSKKSAPAEEIGKGLNMNSVAVEHFLGRLLKASFLTQHPGVGGLVAAYYSLADKGNAYLIENKLVPLSNRNA